jgi:hypothetical protein
MIPARLNFDLGRKNEIHHYSQKEQLKISKITKFGREMSQNEENIALQKFANFVYFCITYRNSHQSFWAESGANFCT